MSSPQHLVASRAPRAVASEPSVRRVRHRLRDQLLVMAFSALVSLAAAGLLALLLATALKVGNQ